MNTPQHVATGLSAGCNGSANPIFDAQGTLIAIQSIGRDVTEQHVSDEAVSQSEERYRRLVEESPDGIMITSQTTVRYVNQALIQMLGATHDRDLVGKTVFDLLHRDYHDVVEARIAQHGHDSEAEPSRHEQFIRLDGTPIDVEVTLMPIDLDDTPATLTYVRDITRRKETEVALHDFQEDLKTLHNISIDLSKAETFDAFCRKAIEMGRDQLRFDRLGLWFLNEEQTHVRGAFGTDAAGQTTDERGIHQPVADKLRANLLADGKTIIFWENVDLCNASNKVIGKGWNAIAPCGMAIRLLAI